MDRYVVSPEDCLILLAIRNSRTLREAARQLGCDAGGLLRKVQRISAEHDVLQKIRGKWLLTGKGLALVGWTQETILTQKRLLLSETVIRIASTSWFSERVLIPATSKLTEILKGGEIQYSIPSSGYETALIEGDCDFVIVCHPPENPVVAHRRICPEDWSLVVSRALAKERFSNTKRISLSDLSSLPFVRHRDLNPGSILPIEFPLKTKSSVSVDNLAGIRAAIIGRLGWSFVPTALVRSEIETGALLRIDHPIKMDRHVCLWWLRSSHGSRKKLSVLEGWLRGACMYPPG